MIVEIFHKQKEESSKISDVIDVALYIFKVDPSHWFTFASISGLDRDSFESKLTDVVHDLLYVQHFCNNSDYSKHQGLTEAGFSSILVQESIDEVVNNIKDWKTQRKTAV